MHTCDFSCLLVDGHMVYGLLALHMMIDLLMGFKLIQVIWLFMELLYVCNSVQITIKVRACVL